MKIAVEGCAHGELENIYETIEYLEEKEKFKVDLLICCGDFQSSRNGADLYCMAIPPKYYNICTFYKYYSGEKTAPILTIFIGGNHEASNYLQELPYGGWVAPNIYYMGNASVIDIAGIRIGGLSGIYKGRDYMKGHYEHPPYSENSKRSVYHIRNLEIFRLKQLTPALDIFISHDWPSGVWNFGNKNQLIRFKPHFKDDIENGSLGSKPTEEILEYLKPQYWFAAHLHCKFAALIPHEDGTKTKFLALDKCLPKRRFLQIVDLRHDEKKDIKIMYDLEWLTILRLTNHLLSIKNVINYMPGPSGNERWDFKPTDEEKEDVKLRFESDLTVPENFEKTADAYVSNTAKKHIQQPCAVLNPQTVLFCSTLGIDDPVQRLLNLDTSSILDSLKDSSSVNISTNTFQEFESPTQTPTIKRTSLILPNPVNNVPDTEDVNQDQDLNSSSDNQIKRVLLPEPVGGAMDNLINDEESTRRTKTDACDDSAKPTIKKFKRRNCAMYENNSD